MIRLLLPLALSLALPVVHAAEAFRPETLPAVASPSFPERTVRITDFGAVADGHTPATSAINQAIAAVAEKGGGRVIIPAGLVTSPGSDINRYLRRSVNAFDGIAAFQERLRRAGFCDTSAAPMDGWQAGIVHTFLARRPPAI